MVCRVAGGLDADKGEIFRLDRIAVTQDRIGSVVFIVDRIEGMAGLAQKIMRRAANDPRPRRGFERPRARRMIPMRMGDKNC